MNVSLHDLLLTRIKEKLPEIKKLYKSFDDDDIPYRFYHQSFKVYWSQGHIEQAVVLFCEIAQDNFTINKWYTQLTSDAFSCGKFQLEHNKDWLNKTRPQIEAWFHTKYFLEMMIKHSNLEKAPNILPSGWAALLYLFNIR